MGRGPLGRARGSGGVVVAIVLVSAGLRAWAAWQVPVPWFAGDEVIYAQLGQALWHHGELRILGAPTGFLSLVYPALAGLPLSLWDVDTGYRVLRVIQPLVMSLAAVPAYLWARSLGAGRWALAAAALTVAIPSLGYSAFVMTEVAFYPLAALAAWALAAAIERPTRGRQALLVGAVALAALTRLQAIVLVPAFVTAVVLDAALARRPRRVLLHVWGLGGFAVLAVAWIVWRAATGGSFFSGLLGGYGQVAHTGYDPGAVARLVFDHAGAVLLLVGVAPACAVASLLVDAARGREADARVRAYVAVAVSLAVWLVLQVGVFAAEHGARLEERYLIALAPVLFVGLAVWLARGGPRPVFRTAWIAILAVALVAALPMKTLIARGRARRLLHQPRALAGARAGRVLRGGHDRRGRGRRALGAPAAQAARWCCRWRWSRGSSSHRSRRAVRRSVRRSSSRRGCSARRRAGSTGPPTGPSPSSTTAIPTGRPSGRTCSSATA